GHGGLTMIRGAVLPAVMALAGLLVSGCGGPGNSPAAPSSRSTTATATAAGPREPPGVAGFHSVRTYDQPAPPARLQIPVIGVSTPLVRLGRLPDGSIEVPHAWNTAGWYDQGSRPGQPGPAVILGHVDSK